MATRTVWGDFISTAQQHLQGVEWSLNDTISVIMRRWKLIGFVALAVTLLAAALLVITPPSYTASTMLQINTRSEQVTNVTDVVSGINSTNEAAVRTEIDVIRSRKLAERVLKKIPELAGESTIAQTNSLLGSVIGAIKFFIFPVSEPEEIASDKQRQRTRLIDGFLANLDVRMTPRSYSILVSFTANDPVLAAKVANALADEYLVSQLEDKFDATQRANTWMNVRIKDMQARVQAADMAVEKFKEARGLTRAMGVTLNEQQLSELNSQLILARTKLAEAEARVSSGNRSVGNTSEVLNNPLIQNLSIQETEVRRKMSDLAAKYGDRHPRMVTVRQELANVQRKINEEAGKIRGSLGNDLEMAQARVRTLEEQLEQLQNKNRLSSDAEVQLAELDRQANAERSLYENFLNRSKEIAQLDFQQADARVIYKAEPPLSKSFPQTKLVLVLAVILGLGLGVALVLVIEALDSGVRTTHHLETLSKLPVLGMIGELPQDVKKPANYVVEKPTGAFTEGIRSIRTVLQFANPDKQVQVLAITSSVPQEGKSLTSISIAQLAAQAENGSVLLIDGDLRRPSLSKQLGLTPKAGLAEVLSGQTPLKQALLKVEKTNLTVLPALGDSQFAQELLGSQKMKTLLADLRKTYSFIIIDCPPVMAVSDAITIGSMADSMLFMVRWGTTPRPLIANAVKQLIQGNVPLSGAVLTRVDLEKQQAYGYGDYGYYYGKYKEYYND